MGEPGGCAGGGADASDSGTRGRGRERRCDGYVAVSHQGARMSRRGVALLAVLWTLTAITMVTAVAMAVASLGTTTTRNRVLLNRAAWAREACGELLQARYAQDASVRR